MDFSLTDEQRAIADLAGDLFAGDGNAPSWAMLTAAGLPALLLPEAAGGSGLGMVELALVQIAQGRGLVTIPLWRHALAAAALGEDAGERLALAIDGEVTARRDGAGWRLEGRLIAAPGLDDARRLVLAAATGGVRRLFAVDLADAGITRAEGVLTDHEPAADLTLAGVAATALDRDDAWLDARATACLVALAVGTERGAIERTAAYVSTRHQFDRPLGSFQAVAARLADAFGDVEVAETLAFELACAIDVGHDPTDIADIAAWHAAQACHRVAHAAMHLHGGIGADNSYPIHRVLLMSRSLELQLGGARRRLARLGARLAA